MSKRLPKILVTLLFAVDHNLSQLAQHFGEFAVRRHSGNVMQADDFLVQFSVHYNCSHVNYFIRSRDRSFLCLNHPSNLDPLNMLLAPQLALLPLCLCLCL